MLLLIHCPAAALPVEDLNTLETPWQELWWGRYHCFLVTIGENWRIDVLCLAQRIFEWLLGLKDKIHCLNQLSGSLCSWLGSCPQAWQHVKRWSFCCSKQKMLRIGNLSLLPKLLYTLFIAGPALPLGTVRQPFQTTDFRCHENQQQFFSTLGSYDCAFPAGKEKKDLKDFRPRMMK